MQIMKLRYVLPPHTKNKAVFAEAVRCFEKRCYTACVSLLILLIDGALIRRQSKSSSNRKTGAKANDLMTKDIFSDTNYSAPGSYHIELLNYSSFMNTLFESARGFRDEPGTLNRNFLHHGMSKRKVLKKDCLKLFWHITKL